MMAEQAGESDPVGDEFTDDDGTSTDDDGTLTDDDGTSTDDDSALTDDGSTALPTLASIMVGHVAATSADIRDWSSGSVRRRLRRHEQRDDWHVVADTLWDQRVFGPVTDWCCACGRFSGREHAGVVCPVCRVKVVQRTARQIRLGHINLPVAIAHPLVADAEPLDAWPIAPAFFWETRHGADLAASYEELVRLSLLEASPEELAVGVDALLELLRSTHAETLVDHPSLVERLVRAMALKPVELFEAD